MGFASDHTLWDHQFHHFGSNPAYEICIFDNRGVGFSSSPASRYTTSQMAFDALDLLKHFKWSGVHLTGYSMGGMISQELCLIAPPGLINSLVLVNTTSGRTLPSLRSLIHVSHQSVNMSIEEHFTWACTIVHPQDWLSKSHPSNPLKTNREALWDWRLDRLSRSPRRLSAEGLNGQRMAVASHHVSKSRLCQIRDSGIPTLVVVGERDQLVRPSNSYYLARVLDAPLFVFENGGHGLIHQYPQEFNHLLTLHTTAFRLPMIPLNDDAILVSVGKFATGSTSRYQMQGLLKFLRDTLKAVPMVLGAGGRVIERVFATRRQSAIAGVDIER